MPSLAMYGITAGMNLIATETERAELRDVIKSTRAEWRERLSLASKLSPTSKLGRKAGVLMLDLDMFEDRIKEVGGEDALVFVVCAQVAGGCTLTEWCNHYGLERGLVWAFLTESEERFERYQRALRGVADEWVGEVVGIADGTDPETVAADKLRVDTRFRAAAVYDKARFSDKAGSGMSFGIGVGVKIEVEFVAPDTVVPGGSIIEHG